MHLHLQTKLACRRHYYALNICKLMNFAQAQNMMGIIFELSFWCYKLKYHQSLHIFELCDKMIRRNNNYTHFHFSILKVLSFAHIKTFLFQSFTLNMHGLSFLARNANRTLTFSFPIAPYIQRVKCEQRTSCKVKDIKPAIDYCAFYCMTICKLHST